MKKCLVLMTAVFCILIAMQTSVFAVGKKPTPTPTPTTTATPTSKPTPTATPTKAPTVKTGSATNVTSSSATLNGTVNANGLSTTAEFVYRTIGSYSSSWSTSKQTVSGSSDTTVSIDISGLSAGTGYSYRIEAENSAGTSYGSENTFTTTTVSVTPTPTPTTCTDSYEPNDNFSEAYGPLSSGSSYSGKICSSSDVDWFKVNITSAGTIALSSTVPSYNDYDLELYDSSYTQIASSTNGSGASELISYSATTTGNYYIKIYGFGGSSNTSNSYTLTYTYTGTATPTPTATPSGTGIIVGTVNDADWGVPIIDATVSTDTGGYTATTDSDGSYVLANVAAGDYMVTASATGYDSASQPVTVVEGTVALANFALVSSIALPTPPPPCWAESIGVSPTRLTLKRKQSSYVSVTIAGSDGCLVEGETVSVNLNALGRRLISVSPSNATTDENGLAIFMITAKKKKGNAKVYFTSDNTNSTLHLPVKVTK